MNIIDDSEALDIQINSKVNGNKNPTISNSKNLGITNNKIIIQNINFEKNTNFEDEISNNAFITIMLISPKIMKIFLKKLTILKTNKVYKGSPKCVKKI